MFLFTAVSMRRQWGLRQACSWQHLQIIAHNNGRAQNSKRDPKGLRYAFGVLLPAVPQHGQLVSLWLHSGNEAQAFCSMSKVKGKTALHAEPVQLGWCRTSSPTPNLNHYGINGKFVLGPVTNDAVHWHKLQYLSAHMHMSLLSRSQSPNVIPVPCHACSIFNHRKKCLHGAYRSHTYCIHSVYSFYAGLNANPAHLTVFVMRFFHISGGKAHSY